MNCPTCGKAVVPMEKFCGECGTPLGLSPATPDFATAEQRFAELKAQYEAGTLDKSAFKSAVMELVVKDEKGEYWTIEAASGQWLWYDGESWVARPRPSAVAAPAPASPPTIAAAPPAQQSTSKKKPPWIAIGVGCGLLLCLGVIIAGAVIAIPLVRKTAGVQGTPAAVTPIVIEPTATLAEVPTEAPQPTTSIPLPVDTPTQGALELPTIELPVKPTPTQGALELPTMELPSTPMPMLPTPTVEQPSPTPLPPPPPKPKTDFIVKEASLLPKSLNKCETPFFEFYVIDKNGKGLTNIQIAYTREGGSSESEIKPSGWHDPNKGYVHWEAVHNVYRFRVVFDASDPSKKFTSQETPPLDTRQVTDTQLLQSLGYCLPGTDCECKSFSYKVVFQRTW